MDRKELMSKIRMDLRERPNSHFSEIYFRVTASRVSNTEVHNALYELLKKDEISTTGGKWRLIEQRRKASCATELGSSYDAHREIQAIRGSAWILSIQMPPVSARTGVAFGVAMLMEALFNAVDRAFRREAARTMPRFHLERKTLLEHLNALP
jgi:hypothetical protein